MKRLKVKIPALTAMMAIGCIAWGLGWMYRPLAPLTVGLALLLETLTSSDKKGGDS